MLIYAAYFLGAMVSAALFSLHRAARRRRLDAPQRDDGDACRLFRRRLLDQTLYCGCRILLH